MTDDEAFRKYLRMLIDEVGNANVIVWSDGQHTIGLELSHIKNYGEACEVRDLYKEFNHQGIKFHISGGVWGTVYPTYLVTIARFGDVLTEVLNGDYVVFGDEYGTFIYKRGHHDLADFMYKCVKRTMDDRIGIWYKYPHHDEF